MPRKAAGEHALRIACTIRVRRTVVASAFAAAVLALTAGCSGGSAGQELPVGCCAYTGSPVTLSTGVPPSPSPDCPRTTASPSPSSTRPTTSASATPSPSPTCGTRS